MWTRAGATAGPTPGTRAVKVSASHRRRDHDSQLHTAQERRLPRRELLAAGLCTLALASIPAVAAAEQVAVEGPGAAAAGDAAGSVTPIYFGNGCFWGRQYDFVNAEKVLGRDSEGITSLVGYAGGRLQSPDNRVCYYYSDELTVYERLGHAEVVQVEVKGSGEAAKEQLRMFAQTYFRQFRWTPFGMMRLDPQDRGPGYRNVIGLPGGINSEFMPILREANVNGMKLVAGRGNEYSELGEALEPDAMNTVYILDSAELPFYRAEQYHQYHNGIGKAFPSEYTQGLKQAAARAGRINPTGCPEYSFTR